MTNPPSQKDAAKEEQKIQKIIDSARTSQAGERKKREEDEEKDREDGRKFVTEVADAYNFKLVGTELCGDGGVGDRCGRVWGLCRILKKGKFLSKFHAGVWVDKSGPALPKHLECMTRFYRPHPP